MPKVRRARFHKESFPSRLGRPDGGLSTGSGIALGDVSVPEDMFGLLGRQDPTSEVDHRPIGLLLVGCSGLL